MAAEDRSAFGLLLLPFLVVAIALTIAQSRRAHLPGLAGPAVHAPFERIVLAPQPANVAAGGIAPPTDGSIAPPASPEISEPPGIAPPAETTAAAPPLAGREPDITIASLDPREPPPLALPDQSKGEPERAPPPAADFSCTPSPDKLASFANVGRFVRARVQPRQTGIDAATFGRQLAAAALAQTEDLVIYTARYQPMAYPMGDVMPLHGACIDVVIRAYRTLGVDLQEEIQRGRPWRGDTNIDHRRTDNLRRFLERAGASLPVSSFPEDYKPGDIVTYRRPFSRVSTSHIAVVTDVLAATGRPMIVHNRGYGPQLEDALFVDRITGHYRYSGPPAPAATASLPADRAAARAAQ